MAEPLIPITRRRVFRRTDAFAPDKPKLQLVEEPLQVPLSPTSVLVKVKAVSLNWRDANIVNGGNPWPVLPKGIPGSDAAGEVIAVGKDVKTLSVGDRVITIVDQKNITGREKEREWLVADVDGVLGDYVVQDEGVLCRTPSYLDPVEAATLTCSVLTAWCALLGIGIGKTVLIQGMYTLKAMILLMSSR